MLRFKIRLYSYFLIDNMNMLFSQ